MSFLFFFFFKEKERGTLSQRIFAVDRIPGLRRHFNVDETPHRHGRCGILKVLSFDGNPRGVEMFRPMPGRCVMFATMAAMLSDAEQLLLMFI